jgi:hypothetical protein
LNPVAVGVKALANAYQEIRKDPEELLVIAPNGSLKLVYLFHVVFTNLAELVLKILFVAGAKVLLLVSKVIVLVQSLETAETFFLDQASVQFQFHHLQFVLLLILVLHHLILVPHHLILVHHHQDLLLQDLLASCNRDVKCTI